MNVTKDSASATEVTLVVEMEPEDEEPFIGRSYRRLVSRIQIPGFRRGKAPRSIVESHVGRPALVQEALEFMIPETLDQVLKDEEIQAFMEPELDLLEIEPVSFKAVVPLEPVVDLGDFRVIRLEREPVEVTDEQVDEVVEQLRYQSAPWEPVERPAQFGDLLNLNVTGIINGEPAINDQGVDFIPQLDNELPGFSVYLEGMTAGQEKDFTLSVPEEHYQEEYAGGECRFTVEVLSVKEKNLPELDDEFAKGVQDGYETLEALRDYVRDQLTESAQSASDRDIQERSLEELLKVASVQASPLIYQRELESMQQERERALSYQRLDLDTYLRFMGQTNEEWREQLRPRAEERLNTYLVLRKLAEVEGIEVSTEDIQAEIDSALENAGDMKEAMEQSFSTDNARESIRSSLVNRHVLQRLVEIVEGPSEDPEKSDERPNPLPVIPAQAEILSGTDAAEAEVDAESPQDSASSESPEPQGAESDA